jgi:two-component system, cell cycle sensor histidine kinase and response regulator CckA
VITAAEHVPADDVRELRERLARYEVEREQVAGELARLRDQLLHPQRMEAVGTLAAGLAHDMNNVLASIIGLADMLLDECETPGIRNDLEQIVAQAERGAELTHSLLAFSRKGQYRKQVVQIDDVIRKTRQLLVHTLPKSIDVSLELHAGTTCVDADPVQLVQVLVNLSLNGSDAMMGGGKLAIASFVDELDATAAQRLSVHAGRYVRLAVSDCGCGMDDVTMRRVFEPFFTTKPLGRGTGLGLAVVWGVVKGHGGTVSVESEPGRGTTFTILLPVSEATIEAKPPARVPLAAAPRDATILVVDDEPVVRAATRRALERFGFKVVDACDGVDALRVYEDHRERINLVILDMGMPNMNGAECFHRLREITAVPVLVVTGYADDKEAQALVALGAALIEKPQPTTNLMIEVTRLLQRTKVKR